MDVASYTDAIQHLQGAADYYLKSGFQSFSEYARAIGLLFEANMYMNKARKEEDPNIKSRLYAVVEKVLLTSADAFNAAEHPEKRDQALQLLEKTKQDKELALSLDEIMRSPAIISTTAALVTPTPTHEKAVGIKRFDHADVEAHLTVSEEVTVGEELSCQLDLVNVGNNSALLVRLSNMVIKGFKLAEHPSQYEVNNGVVEFKGKRLEPLKVESINMNLQAMDVGVFELSPQLTYVDDLGKFKTQRPEPTTITVKPKLTFQFKTQSAQNAFNYLSGCFVEDYMKRRMTLENSGWRTLMAIVKDGGIPKSSVYGSGGHQGRAISELEARGLVESRIFTGERGRGGRILRFRISYDKDIVRRHVDQRIMKKMEK
jgi:hypothetical protein